MSKAKKATPSDASENMATVLQNDEYKVVIVGALGVGKTSLMLRFISDTFEERISRFISEERKPIVVKDAKGKDREITLDLWDTAGQERFQSITNRFYQDTCGVIIVYDIVAEESFHDLEFWVREVQYYLPQELDNGMPVLLVGNKKDLVDRYDVNQTSVKLHMVQEIAHSNGFLRPLECSAKTGEGVKKIFTTMGSELLRCSRKRSNPTIRRTNARCCAVQ